MYRYISLIWNEADSQATETAEFLTNYFYGTVTKWSVAYCGEAGLRVLHTGEEKNRMQAYPLDTQQDGTGGVVLGKLFDRPSNPETIPGNANLNTGEARKVIDSAGRHLVDDYWGSWVAFFQAGNKKHVLVDPIGTFCCFSTHYRGVEIYFTYIPDVASCEFLRFSIDWIPLAKFLRYSIEKNDVALQEVSKILPGQCITTSPWATEKTFYWNPQKISQTNMLEDVEEAEEALRQSLHSTTAALAAPYNKVLHQIGGLDSSILLACLKEVPSKLDVTCLNIFHENPMGDERYYVRKATSHVGVPLIEHAEAPATLSFEALQNIPLTTGPLHYAQQIGLEKDVSRMMKEQGIQAVFSGLGGDEILYATAASYGASDYVKSYGLHPRLLRLVTEAARMQNLSVWSILPKILRDGYGNQQWDLYKELDMGKATLLNADIQTMIKPDNSVHPWIMKNDNALPGKLDHIVAYTKGIYDQEGKTSPNEHVPMLYPMLAQPVIETCLRVPSWIMTADGKTRGLARKAFQHYLPTEVIWRESKLGAGFHAKALVQENFVFFRECLLDGVLVSEHVLNKSSVEKALAMDHDIGNRDNAWLIWYIYAEIWARKWRGQTASNITRINAA